MTFRNKGFTMMELLVTVLLIAILAGMAMPQYMKVVEKQKGTETVNLLASIGKAEERYFAVNQTYTTDFSDLDTDLVDYNSRTAPSGGVYYTKYFFFQLTGTEDGTSKVVATRRGNESYVLERNYTTGEVCCRNDNTSDGDICDVLDITGNTCDSAEPEDTGGTTGGGTTPTTCSGTAPATTQACASGCGSQTRSVTCSSGTWVTGSWSGTCTSPTQTLPTSQSCGTGGTQTRTCTASCGGGTCSAWSTCTGQSCGTTSQPTPTQNCASGCGTQTRTVTCNNGSWELGPWTGTCTSPTQTQPTSQSCGTGGTQTRTCTASCSGGTCGAWSTCSVVTCNTATKPAESQSCGNCNKGTQTRTVTCNTSTGTWSSGSWSTCSGGGECSSGQTQSCGSGGTQTCSSSCSWGTCTGQTCSSSTKPAETQSCGNCSLGTQTRTVTCDTSTATWSAGSWSTCVGSGECKAGLQQGDNYSCIYGPIWRTCQSDCTWGPFSECAPTTIDCPSSSKPISSQSCGNCNKGTQTRPVSCDTSSGTWVTGSWTTCSGGGTCAPGATTSCQAGKGTITCSSSCTWGSCACNSGYEMVNGSCCMDDGCQCQLDQKGSFCKWSSGNCVGWGCSIYLTGGTCGKWELMYCAL